MIMACKVDVIVAMLACAGLVRSLISVNQVYASLTSESYLRNNTDRGGGEVGQCDVGDKISDCHACDNLPAHRTASAYVMKKGTISSKKYRNYGHGGIKYGQAVGRKQVEEELAKKQAQRIQRQSGEYLAVFLSFTGFIMFYRTPEGQCK
jgi:hypothetical protein